MWAQHRGARLVIGCSCASRWSRGKLSTNDLTAGPAAGWRRMAPISLDSISYAWHVTHCFDSNCNLTQ